MTHQIPVRFIIDRRWNIEAKEWAGRETTGTLIDISTQTAEDNSGATIPVGIVVLETGEFKSVPVEFITMS